MNKSRRKKLAEASEMISQASSIIESVMDEEHEAYDNLPESIMDGERGEKMEQAIEFLESAISDLESAVENIDSASS